MVYSDMFLIVGIVMIGCMVVVFVLKGKKKV